MSVRSEHGRGSLVLVGVVVGSWFALTALGPAYRRIPGLVALHASLAPALRMTLMLLVTWAYVGLVERRSFADGFSWSAARLGRSLAWALGTFVAATALVAAYQALVVAPLLGQTVEASAAEELARPPLWSRLVEYLYIVYEGVVESLVFVAFLLDRLLRRWRPAWALLASNVVFALWHYAYWRQGLLAGSLMIALTFLAGTVISVGYLATRNAVTPTVAHFLVDAPSGLKELFGLAIPFVS